MQLTAVIRAWLCVSMDSYSYRAVMMALLEHVTTNAGRPQQPRNDAAAT